MATSSATGSGSVVECQAQVEESENTLKLNLKKEEKKKKLKWTEDTVDNEGLGKKKSKCCCQYTKPKQDLERALTNLRTTVKTAAVTLPQTNRQTKQN